MRPVASSSKFAPKDLPPMPRRSLTGSNTAFKMLSTSRSICVSKFKPSEVSTHKRFLRSTNSPTMLGFADCAPPFRTPCTVLRPAESAGKVCRPIVDPTQRRPSAANAKALTSALRLLPSAILITLIASPLLASCAGVQRYSPVLLPIQSSPFLPASKRRIVLPRMPVCSP